MKSSQIFRSLNPELIRSDDNDLYRRQSQAVTSSPIASEATTTSLAEEISLSTSYSVPSLHYKSSPSSLYYSISDPPSLQSTTLTTPLNYAVVGSPLHYTSMTSPLPSAAPPDQQTSFTSQLQYTAMSPLSRTTSLPPTRELTSTGSASVPMLMLRQMSSSISGAHSYDFPVRRALSNTPTVTDLFDGMKAGGFNCSSSRDSTATTVEDIDRKSFSQLSRQQGKLIYLTIP